jgi:hypothetical protein
MSMAEFALTVLIFFGVIAIAFVLFMVWLVVSVIRLIVQAMMPRRLRAPRPPVRPAFIRCRGDGCGADNPGSARFCRRCGRELETELRGMRIPRAALW